MPELPEVEHVAAGLRQEILNRRIDSMVVHSPVILKGPGVKHWRKESQAFTGQTITVISRRAKRLILQAEDQRTLIVQLGMTGRFLLHGASQPAIVHTHFSIHLADGRRLDYVDPRRFGHLWLMGRVDGDLEVAMLAAGFGQLGPEPFQLSGQMMVAILDSSRPVKNLLLDQGRLAGLGNIYADEALFAAGIDPLSCSRAIPADRADQLRKAIPRILNRSIRCGGTTFSDFRNPYGEPGRFLHLLKVYGRDGQPCRTCDRTIERLVLSGRSAHFCPACQRRF